MSDNLLRADAISYDIGAKSLVRNATLSVGGSARLAVIGPNGAGKSTLLRMMAGLLRPTSGAIYLDGINIDRFSPLERARRFASVGQADSPDHQLRAADYVALGRIPHAGAGGSNDDRAIVADAMERAGVAQFAQRSVGSLSGGERQRLQLARAIAQQPSILFLDEPTNHLDPKARSALLALVAGLGVTTIAVLHDLALVAPFATEVAVMHCGGIVAAGSPDATLTPHIVGEVFDLDVLRLRHPYHDRDLMVFEASNPSAPDQLRSIQ